jgi:hypothetical protein
MTPKIVHLVSEVGLQTTNTVHLVSGVLYSKVNLTIIDAQLFFVHLEEYIRLCVHIYTHTHTHTSYIYTYIYAYTRMHTHNIYTAQIYICAY